MKLKESKLTLFAFSFLLCAFQLPAARPPAGQVSHFLYVASPGIRNYVEYGGVGVLVFDMDNGFKFVRRIPTWSVTSGEKPENVKGIAASAKDGRIYVTNNKRMIALDAVSGKVLWDNAYDGGCDRLAISPDGKTLYVPQLEGNFWNVVDALTGAVITKIETDSGAHNTIYSLGGKRVYMAGLRSNTLSITASRGHRVLSTVGPFSDFIRPFTVNGSNSLCFVNVNKLLGFEVGDVRSGKMLYRVEVQGYKQGPVKRHGCPSHGIAMTPDEKEIWLSDGANNAIHIFDATVMPPRQEATIKLRDMPGWITMSMDGRYAFPSTGEIIDVATRKVIAKLTDEEGRGVQSEKLLEITMAKGKVVAAGNQFGVGMKRR